MHKKYITNYVSLGFFVVKVFREVQFFETNFIAAYIGLLHVELYYLFFNIQITGSGQVQMLCQNKGPLQYHFTLIIAFQNKK